MIPLIIERSLCRLHMGGWIVGLSEIECISAWANEHKSECVMSHPNKYLINIQVMQYLIIFTHKHICYIHTIYVYLFTSMLTKNLGVVCSISINFYNKTMLSLR